jgi:hypothetical protein
MNPEGPVSVAKTALPKAIASSAARPKVSSREGKTKNKQDRMRAETRGRFSVPRKRTREPSRRTFAKRRK